LNLYKVFVKKDKFKGLLHIYNAENK